MTTYPLGSGRSRTGQPSYSKGGNWLSEGLYGRPRDLNILVRVNYESEGRRFKSCRVRLQNTCKTEDFSHWWAAISPPIPPTVPPSGLAKAPSRAGWGPLVLPLPLRSTPAAAPLVACRTAFRVSRSRPHYQRIQPRYVVSTPLLWITSSPIGFMVSPQPKSVERPLEVSGKSASARTAPSVVDRLMLSQQLRSIRSRPAIARR